jgi:hypothetical protein
MYSRQPNMLMLSVPAKSRVAAPALPAAPTSSQASSALANPSERVDRRITHLPSIRARRIFPTHTSHQKACKIYTVF